MISCKRHRLITSEVEFGSRGDGRARQLALRGRSRRRSTALWQNARVQSLASSPHAFGNTIADNRATSDRRVAAWLFVCCALVFAMVVVGGVTRLTHSGLSIVEWQPIIGTLPPLSQADWQETFAQISVDAPIPAGQQRDDPRRVQGHLLVGILASAPRPPDRHRLSRPAAVVHRKARIAARPRVESCSPYSCWEACRA